MLQFLIYAVAVALAGRSHRTGPALVLLVIVHVVAAPRSTCSATDQLHLGRTGDKSLVQVR